MTKLKSKSGLIPLSEALILVVKNAKVGKYTKIIFKCINCIKPNEYPQSSQGEDMVECGYCSHINLVESVSVQIGLSSDLAG